MKMNILLFATLKDRAGAGKLSVDVPDPATVSTLKAALAEAAPRLAEHLPHALVAVNREFAFPDDLLHEGDEVALFPPVSGGSGPEPRDGIRNTQYASRITDHTLPTLFQITESALDLNALLASITLPTTGAACIFTGMVRGQTIRGEAHETSYLDYEAYQPMAEGKMRQVAEEIRERWPEVEGIAIVQRIGRLEPGTPTVLIACTAAHRDTGVFEAARYGIDRLKEIVPIWKKEVGPDGEEWVEGGYEPSEIDRES